MPADPHVQKSFDSGMAILYKQNRSYPSLLSLHETEQARTTAVEVN